MPATPDDADATPRLANHRPRRSSPDSEIISVRPSVRLAGIVYSNYDCILSNATSKAERAVLKREMDAMAGDGPSHNLRSSRRDAASGASRAGLSHSPSSTTARSRAFASNTSATLDAFSLRTAPARSASTLTAARSRLSRGASPLPSSARGSPARVSSSAASAPSATSSLSSATALRPNARVKGRKRASAVASLELQADSPRSGERAPQGASMIAETVSNGTERERMLWARRQAKRRRRNLECRQQDALGNALVIAPESLESASDLQTSRRGWQEPWAPRDEAPEIDVDRLERVPFDAESRTATVARTADGDVLMARGGRPSQGFEADVEAAVEEAEALEARVGGAEEFKSRAVKRQIILGTTRSQSDAPHLVGTFKKNEDEWRALFAKAHWRRVCKHATRFVQTYFPNVHRRYMDAEPDGPGLHYIFGCFSLLAINFPSRGQPVQTRPHRDDKNPRAGFASSSRSFDSRRRHWLMLKELGLVVEVPGGVPVAFPFALITHGNVDFDVVEATTRADACAGHGRPRGSLVFFTHANVISYAEMEGRTQKAVKAQLGYEPVYDGMRDIFRIV